MTGLFFNMLLGLGYYLDFNIQRLCGLHSLNHIRSVVVAVTTLIQNNL